jgi:hypothetical protein
MMSALSMYTMAAEYRQMVEHLMSTQDDVQTIEDTIDGELYPLEMKAQGVGYAVKNLEATAAAIKGAEQEMATRRKAIEKRAEALKEYAKTCLEIAGISKLDTPHFALTIKKNPPSVDVWDERQIPAEFMRLPEPPPPPIAVPDKTKIKEAIKAGREVPGAQMAQGSRLEIK